MNKLLMLATASALLCTTPALADEPGNQGGGQGGCGVGQQTNGCGPTNNGGDGGQGGSAAQAQGQVQGQAQGQLQGQSQTGVLTNVNAPTTIATGGRSSSDAEATAAVLGSGNSSNHNRLDTTNVLVDASRDSTSSSSASTSSATQSQAASSNQTQTNTLTGNNSDASSSSAGQTATFIDDSVYEAQKRAPVSSAYAAPLAIGGGVCKYTPASASGQFVSFGFSGSGAATDNECERRATSDVFARIGMTYEACLIMAGAPHAKAVGITCQRPVPSVAAQAAPVPLPAHVPVTMAPVPNPIPVRDGERG